MERPSIHDIYMSMAFVFSQYSHDYETQHGCIITDPDHHIVSCGTNGLPKGVNDFILPRRRPKNDTERIDPYKNKYLWMLHSERNAISNCAIKPPKNSIAYVTGQCCNDCIMALWQFGITTVYMADLHGSYLIDDLQKTVFDLFVKQTGIKIYMVTPSFSIFQNILDKYERNTSK